MKKGFSFKFFNLAVTSLWKKQEIKSLQKLITVLYSKLFLVM